MLGSRVRRERLQMEPNSPPFLGEEKEMTDSGSLDLSSREKIQLEEEREIKLLKWHLELLIDLMDEG